MRYSFRKQVSILKACANRFDEAGIEQKMNALRVLSMTPLVPKTDLATYAEVLLFLIAYPFDTDQLTLAERELKRVTRFLKGFSIAEKSLFENSGLPFTHTVTRFSHDALQWLLAHPHCTVKLHTFEEATTSLNEVLALTLPSLERSETTIGYNNWELMDGLQVAKSQRLSFLVNELSKLNHLPHMKDYLFDRLEVFVQVVPKVESFSKAFNRLAHTKTYFTRSLLKKFDGREILDQPLPPPVRHSLRERDAAIRVVKNSMAITARETDPTTFMEEGSFRVYTLDRGISIAIYGMIPSRQLPLESYVGFTAFKNGLPAAYGGAWVFGERASFGMNVFETFRGGESAYMMMQLLRVYKAVFGVQYVEIEPNQFGLDNPEGIASGAFWFYYRQGFRPEDTSIRLKAKTEFGKMQNRKGYRSGEATLMQFTQSSLVLALGNYIPLRVTAIFAAVTRMIQRAYGGNRQIAEADCTKKFIAKTGLKGKLSDAEKQVLTEVAFWAEACKVTAPGKLAIMSEMIRTKPVDVYGYQVLLVQFFLA
jgi:hypothetical protein